MPDLNLDATDPIPTAAVEAAARVLYIAEHAQHPGAAQTWDDGYKAQEDWMLVWFARALVALTAAAPHIAKQATADDPRKVAHIQCDCVPDLGPSHCHLCSERAGREMPWTEAHPDLRAGIEALQDEWREGAQGRFENGRHPGTLGSCADALDALIGGAK